MTVHWTYAPVPDLKNSEIACRTASTELAQAGHFHDQAQIAVVTEGWRSFTTALGTYIARPGDIAVIPPRMFHAPSMEARSAASILYLESSHPIARAVREPAIIDGNGAEHWLDILDRVGSALPSQVAEQEITSDKFISLVVETRLSVHQIAEELDLTTDGFIRCFAKAVGATPAKYRIAHRLTIARKMLREGLVPADAAYAAGFADQSHLGRCFLKAYGTTPAAYRTTWRHDPG
jgi:AraC-like DNA-binding protein